MALSTRLAGPYKDYPLEQTPLDGAMRWQRTRRELLDEVCCGETRHPSSLGSPKEAADSEPVGLETPSALEAQKNVFLLLKEK